MGTANEQAKRDFLQCLLRLHTRAGEPAPESLAARSQQLPRTGKYPYPLKDSTVQGWLAGKSRPRSLDVLRRLLETYALLLRVPVRDLPGAAELERRWEATRAKPADPGAVRPADGAPEQDPWAELAAHSPGWQRVTPDEDPEPLRGEVADAIGRLAALRDRAHADLDGDPWADPGLGARIAGQLGSLLTNELKAADLTLTPAEAALLALLPFLYYLRRVRRAIALTAVDPTALDQRAPAGDQDRGHYETFLRGHEALVRRAGLSHLADRTDGVQEIGWWLFHRWLDTSPVVRRQPTVSELLAAADIDPARPLGKVLDADAVERVLSGPRRPPYELCGIERPSHLRPERWVGGVHTPRQQVREQLVGCLFAVAQALAVEVTDLPDVVVKHIGVPDPVAMTDLTATVRTAVWEPQANGEGLALSARCTHPAVVAALSAHAGHVDDLLRAVRRCAAGSTHVMPLAALPVYACADDVREVDAAGRVAVAAITRFRLDEDRVRELLTGEPLYGDRSLAVRELYQNALDACRYRRAREQARAREIGLRGDHPGRGEFGIDFRQGTENGRAYLECRDNGVGMGEAELTGVFSQAGVRFAGQSSFHDEEARWKQLDPPVVLYPNSRFGIGVLSYFMLADEIEVTTRRMDHEGRRGTELAALITGPGNFFRVRPTGREGPVGTTVRLYLRDGDDAPSCVDVLNRLLAIAEFPTTAQHGGRTARWTPGELRTRRALPYEQHGLAAEGVLSTWQNGQDGVDGEVVWCREGGALLVDGLLVAPGELRGILDLNDGGTLHGVVVNLTGATSPSRLSVDRLRLQDDRAHLTVRDLVIRAAGHLAAAGTPTPLEWLVSIAKHNAPLADILTAALTAADGEVVLSGKTFRTGRAGLLLRDGAVPGMLEAAGSGSPAPVFDTRYLAEHHYGTNGDPADDVFLWRLLAHRPPAELAEVADLFPDLLEPVDVMPALPSDEAFTGDESALGLAPTLTPLALVSAARARLSSLRDAAERARALGFEVTFPHLPEGEADAEELALLAAALTRRTDSAIPEDAVGLDGVLNVHFQLRVSVADAARRIARYGFAVPGASLLPLPTDPDVHRLLTVGRNGETALSSDLPVSVDHVTRAAEELGRPVADLIRQLASYGYRTALDPFLDPADRTTIVAAPWQDGGGADDSDSADAQLPLPPGQVVEACEALGLSAGEVSRRLRSAGLVPPTLPDRILPEDSVLLRIAPLLPSSRWLPAGAHVRGGQVASAAVKLGISPAAVRKRLRAYGLTAPDLPYPERVERLDVDLLSTDLDGFQPWRHEDEPVKPGELLLASIRLGATAYDLAERLRSWGMEVSGEPPRGRPSPDELLLLSRDSDGEKPWLNPSAPVPPVTFVRHSTRLSCTVQDVADRLSALGFTCPTDLPDAEPHDVELLAAFAHCFEDSFEGTPSDTAKPRTASRLEIAQASVEVGLPPRDIARRLRAYHAAVEDGPLPERITVQDRKLLSIVRGPVARRVSLAELFEARTELGLTVREIHERYAELGAAVPDQESVREALARVPRRPAAG